MVPVSPVPLKNASILTNYKEEVPDARKPVGLLFAGSMIVTIANPIGEVLSLLGVTIDGE